MPVLATFFTLLMVGFIIAGFVYAVMVLWPQRPPKEKTVAAIKERIDAEQQGGN